MKIQILSMLNTIFDMKMQKNKNISEIRYLMLGNMQVKTKTYILYLLYSYIEHTILRQLKIKIKLMIPILKAIQ